MAMKQTPSVYEVSDPVSRRYAVEFIANPDKMKIIMVKGIGYVVVNQNLENPETFRKMGNAVARTFE